MAVGMGEKCSSPLCSFILYGVSIPVGSVAVMIPAMLVVEIAVALELLVTVVSSVVVSVLVF